MFAVSSKVNVLGCLCSCIHICVCLYVLMQSIWKQLISVTGWKVDVLILKQFTVAYLIGCGNNPSQSYIRGPGGEGGVGVDMGLHVNHVNHIFWHTLHPKDISCSVHYLSQLGKSCPFVQAEYLLFAGILLILLQFFSPLDRFLWLSFPLTHTSIPLTVWSQ